MSRRRATSPIATRRNPPVPPAAPGAAGPSRRRGGLDASLWVAQGLIATTFVGGGVWKLVTPLAQVAATFPWAGEVPPAVLQVSAVFDILGGLGVLLPSLTRIRPRLTVLAALGCVALQGSAIVFHVARGEGGDIAVNVALLAVAGFIAWGRSTPAPIARRG